MVQQEVDPRVAVQTGPGLPRWQWREQTLRWDGPVTREQQMRLWLAPPWLTALWNIAGLGLMLVVLLRLAGWRSPQSAPSVAAMSVALLCLGLVSPAVDAAEPPDSGDAPAAQNLGPTAPPPALLDELRERLLAPPPCTPNCVVVPRMAVQATAGQLTLRLSVHAAAFAALPLPGGQGAWLPQRVLLDGQAAAVRRAADGRLWLAVSPGVHQVLLDGALGDSQPLPLPLKPRQVSVVAGEYEVHGVEPDGTVEDALQFTRRQRRAADAQASGALAPFARIVRRLALGLRWEVHYRAERVGDPQQPMLLDIPLLPGEAIVSEAVKSDGKRARVVLPAGAEAIEWIGTLPISETIALGSSDNLRWVEVWQLDAATHWHVEFQGIPVVHLQREGNMQPQWQPWPGEKVNLRVSRPEAVAGASLTLDGAKLFLKPGSRAN